MQWNKSPQNVEKFSIQKSRITPFSDKNRSNRQRNLRVKRVKFSAEVRHANVAVLEF